MNPAEPSPTVGLPPPPGWLSPKARRIYRQLAREVVALRVGSAGDGEALALAAVAREQYETADELVRREGVTLTRVTQTGTSRYRNPAATERADAWRRYRDALRAFALDPQSRSGVDAVPDASPSAIALKYFRDNRGHRNDRQN